MMGRRKCFYISQNHQKEGGFPCIETIKTGCIIPIDNLIKHFSTVINTKIEKEHKEEMSFLLILYSNKCKKLNLTFLFTKGVEHW